MNYLQIKSSINHLGFLHKSESSGSRGRRCSINYFFLRGHKHTQDAVLPLCQLQLASAHLGSLTAWAVQIMRRQMDVRSSEVHTDLLSVSTAGFFGVSLLSVANGKSFISPTKAFGNTKRTRMFFFVVTNEPNTILYAETNKVLFSDVHWCSTKHSFYDIDS